LQAALPGDLNAQHQALRRTPQPLPPAERWPPHRELRSEGQQNPPRPAAAVSLQLQHQLAGQGQSQSLTSRPAGLLLRLPCCPMMLVPGRWLVGPRRCLQPGHQQQLPGVLLPRLPQLHPAAAAVSAAPQGAASAAPAAAAAAAAAAAVALPVAAAAAGPVAPPAPAAPAAAAPAAAAAVAGQAGLQSPRIASCPAATGMHS
jgi:hypothetical protein